MIPRLVAHDLPAAPLAAEFIAELRLRGFEGDAAHDPGPLKRR